MHLGGPNPGLVCHIHFAQLCDHQWQAQQFGTLHLQCGVHYALWKRWLREGINYTYRLCAENLEKWNMFQTWNID